MDNVQNCDAYKKKFVPILKNYFPFNDALFIKLSALPNDIKNIQQ
jgi:hypothetical protein